MPLFRECLVLGLPNTDLAINLTCNGIGRRFGRKLAGKEKQDKTVLEKIANEKRLSDAINASV
jgi:hypothetical protein